MNEAIYYIYSHKRLDTGDIFYIGIGTKNITKKYKCHIYYRAYIKSQSRRSSFWRNVYLKCGENIQIDIIKESKDLDEIKELEKYYISLYGKRIDNTGTLVNITNGGDGTWGYKWSEEAKMRKSLSSIENNPFKGKTHSEETRKYLSDIMKERYKNNEFKNKEYKHSDTIKHILSIKGKERWKRGELHPPPIMKGSDNHFSKKIIAFSPEGERFIIEGSIKKFCEERDLSYEYSKKYRNKGKINIEIHSRMRRRCFNTLGWEFIDDNKEI